MNKIIFLSASMVFIIGGLALTHYLKKRNLLPNRWLIGCAVFLVALIPSLLFPNMQEVVKQVIFAISGLLAVVFFESSRLRMEQNRME